MEILPSFTHPRCTTCMLFFLLQKNMIQLKSMGTNIRLLFKTSFVFWPKKKVLDKFLEEPTLHCELVFA